MTTIQIQQRTAYQSLFFAKNEYYRSGHQAILYPVRIIIEARSTQRKRPAHQWRIVTMRWRFQQLSAAPPHLWWERHATDTFGWPVA